MVEVGGGGRQSRKGARGGRSAAINDSAQETGLETPAVRRFGLVSSGLAPEGRGPGQQQEKGSARFLLCCRRAGGQAGGREGAPKCPVRRGVEWAGLHMVDAWAGGFDAGGLGMWARWACLAVRPPLEPRSWKYRPCTDAAPCTPGHTHLGTLKVGMFQRTCRSGSLGKGAAAARPSPGYGSPGTVPELAYPANGRVETLEVK